MVIMGYQKISEMTENRMREFVKNGLKGEAAKRGRKSNLYYTEQEQRVYTFDEALDELLSVVGF